MWKQNRLTVSWSAFWKSNNFFEGERKQWKKRAAAAESLLNVNKHWSVIFTDCERAERI